MEAAAPTYREVSKTTASPLSLKNKNMLWLFYRKKFKKYELKIGQIMDMIGDPNIALVLVGNKSDLQQNEREVSKEQVCWVYRINCRTESL